MTRVQMTVLADTGTFRRELTCAYPSNVVPVSFPYARGLI